VLAVLEEQVQQTQAQQVALLARLHLFFCLLLWAVDLAQEKTKPQLVLAVVVAVVVAMLAVLGVLALVVKETLVGKALVVQAAVVAVLVL